MSQIPSLSPRPASIPSSTPPASSSRRLDARLPSLSASQSFEADQYRTLRHTVEMARAERDVRVIGVTSPVAGDGKTLTAVNLAGALAHARGSRVLLIDADLRRPSIGKVLGAFHVEGPGLAEALAQGTVTLDKYVRRLDRFRLSVLAAHRTDVDAYEALSSPRLGELIAEARRLYEYVIIDTPPLVPVPDPRLLVPWVDAFLIVVRAGKTPRKLLGAALSQLDPRKVLGLVFNGSDLHGQRYGKYYYSYTRRS
jgi:capsular exopolysaccharide synthesis family protein